MLIVDRFLERGRCLVVLTQYIEPHHDVIKP